MMYLQMVCDRSQKGIQTIVEKLSKLNFFSHTLQNLQLNANYSYSF